ncbi:MAG TPA: ATP-binding protein [bacterium]|nr:ATP-binding protein [bacterium]HPN30653.1 ATP-binding protein [bacterium]
MIDINNIDLLNFLNNIASGFIIISSRDFRIKFINKTAINILNVKTSIDNKPISEILDNEIIIDSIHNTVSEKKSFARIVTKILFKDKESYLGFTTSPYINETGELIGVVINFRDLTSEIELESKLQYSELKYKLLIQNLLSPVFIVSYEDYSLIEYNLIAMRKFGLKKKKPDKIIFTELLADEVKNNFHDYLNRIKTNRGKEKSVEIRIGEENNNYIFDATAALFEINSEKFIQIICFDITEKSALQSDLFESYNALKATQELMIRAERLAAVGELAAGISHEIKNRFQVIANAVSYLKLKSDKKDESIAANIKYIENEVARGVKLINDLTDFARPHPPQKNYINVNDAIKNTIPLIRKQLDKNRILYKESLGNIPNTFADYNLIQQVILNVLKNAEESMRTKQNNILSVKTYKIPAKDINPLLLKNKKSFNEYIAVGIKDTGIGINEQNLSKIFTPFFSLKSPNEGTGLGLSVSHSIIERHSGFITVDSVLGEGSEFTIYIPVTDNN